MTMLPPLRSGTAKIFVVVNLRQSCGSGLRDLPRSLADSVAPQPLGIDQRGEQAGSASRARTERIVGSILEIHSAIVGIDDNLAEFRM
jgi:hypothetical protein